MASTAEQSLDESVTVNDGLTIKELSHARRNTLGVKRTPKGGTLTRADAAWYVFDNLTCDQAEDLLQQHGDHGTYLIAHFHEPESFGLSFRINENGKAVFKHYAVGIIGDEFQVEGMPGQYSSIERIVELIGEKVSVKLVPIFHHYDQDQNMFSITMSAEAPPEYSEAKRYPEAARKPLPIIVPVYPTLRRMHMLRSSASHRENVLSQSGDLPEEITAPPNGVEHRSKGCCWKACHTDVEGKWWKPHKAGPCMAILLTIGWILFLVFFGWIVGLALILVLILVMFAYCINFLCTGRCSVEEEEQEQQNVAPGRLESAYGRYDGTGNTRHTPA